MSNRVVPSSPARAPSTYRQLVARCTARCDSATVAFDPVRAPSIWRSIPSMARRARRQGRIRTFLSSPAVRPSVCPSSRPQRPSRRCCSRSAGCPAAGAMFLSAAGHCSAPTTGHCSAPTTGRLSPSCSLAHRRTEVTVGLWVAGPPAMGQAAGQRKQER